MTLSPSPALQSLLAALTPARIAQVVAELRAREGVVLEPLPAVPKPVRW